MASCVLLQEHHSEHVLKNLVELDTSLHISTASGGLSVSSTLLQLFREDFKKIVHKEVYVHRRGSYGKF